MIPHFDPTISLGTILSLATIIIGAFRFWIKFEIRVNLILDNQREVLSALTTRFHEHELRDEEMFRKMQERIGDLSGGIQRLIGETSLFRKYTREPE